MYFLYGMGYLIVLVILACGFLWCADRIKDLIYRFRVPPELQRAMAEVEARRLQNPDWAAYAQHLGREAPAALKELFLDEKILKGGLEYDDLLIVAFSPLDARAVNEAKKDEWAYVPFALGDDAWIYLQPGAHASPAVFVDYEGSVEELAPDVATFLSKLRVTVSSAD